MRARHFTLESRDAGDIGALAEAMRGLVEPPHAVTAAVAEILTQVRRQGDSAVHELTRRWDSKAAPADFRVPADQIAAAPREIDREVRVGLDAAIANVERLAQAEVAGDLTVEMPQGQSVTIRELPVRRVGAYVPGGRAAYPSSVVMCCVPARVAGVEEVAVATPPGPDGRPNPVILAACALSGVDEVHLMGGAQAIAALAYGTATVAPVDVIVGPGNSFVQEAKRQVAGLVGIDGIAGPSELLVIADEDADPRMVALDLAAQAEHGPDTLVAVASPYAGLLAEVEREAAALVAERPSVQDAPLALVRTPDLDTAIDVANAFAPEHLELACADAETLVERVRASGCVFVGAAGGAAFGDYAAGSNHVLPDGQRRALLRTARRRRFSAQAGAGKVARGRGAHARALCGKRRPGGGFPRPRRIGGGARGLAHHRFRERLMAITTPPRAAEIDRATGETNIRLRLALDGAGECSAATGVGFFDHMLDLLARHGRLDLDVEATGDLETGSHHTTEDVGIVLGQALDRALGDRSGIARYGDALVPWTRHWPRARSTSPAARIACSKVRSRRRPSAAGRPTSSRSSSAPSPTTRG